MSDSTSAMTSAIDVAHLARLARLVIEPGEQDQARAELTNIINMIDVMQSIDTAGVAPMASPMDAVARLREDKVTEQVDVTKYQAIAPSTQGGYYLVPRVVE